MNWWALAMTVISPACVAIHASHGHPWMAAWWGFIGGINVALLIVSAYR